MTGTGNTKRAAKLVQLQLNSMGHDCEVLNWIHEDFESWDAADAFGFAAPVHSFREPTPFRNNLKSLPKSPNDRHIPVFILSSCEGAVGNFYYRVAKILKKKGATIIGVKTFYAPSNVLMWEKSIERSIDHDPSHDKAILYFAKQLPELIEKNEPLPIKRHFWSGLFAALTKDWGLRAMIRGKIKVDESLCIQCGLCAQNCIAQCIHLDPYPKINMKECVACLGCINLCPKDALNAKNTIGKRRFKGLGKISVSPL